MKKFIISSLVFFGIFGSASAAPWSEPLIGQTVLDEHKVALCTAEGCEVFRQVFPPEATCREDGCLVNYLVEEADDAKILSGNMRYAYDDAAEVICIGTFVPEGKLSACFPAAIAGKTYAWSSELKPLSYYIEDLSRKQAVKDFLQAMQGPDDLAASNWLLP